MAGPHQPSGLPDADLPHQKYMYVCMLAHLIIQMGQGFPHKLDRYYTTPVRCRFWGNHSITLFIKSHNS